MEFFSSSPLCTHSDSCFTFPESLHVCTAICQEIPYFSIRHWDKLTAATWAIPYISSITIEVLYHTGFLCCFLFPTNATLVAPSSNTGLSEWLHSHIMLSLNHGLYMSHLAYIQRSHGSFSEAWFIFQLLLPHACILACIWGAVVKQTKVKQDTWIPMCHQTIYGLLANYKTHH